jgi:hypothetical protein
MQAPVSPRKRPCAFIDSDHAPLNKTKVLDRDTDAHGSVVQASVCTLSKQLNLHETARPWLAVFRKLVDWLTWHSELVVEPEPWIDAVCMRSCVEHMYAAVEILSTYPQAKQSSVRKELMNHSRELSRIFERQPSPVATLLSIGVLSRLRRVEYRSQSEEWNHLTSNCLLQLSVQHLGENHPVSLFLKAMLFGTIFPETLDMLIRLVRTHVERAVERRHIWDVHKELITAINAMGYGTQFEVYTEATISKVLDEQAESNPAAIFDIVCIRLQQRRWGEAVRVAQPCRSTADVAMAGERWIEMDMARSVAYAQRMMGDHEGEMASLLRALAILPTVPAPDKLSVQFLLSALDSLYRRSGLEAQGRALRLEYADYFEEE